MSATPRLYFLHMTGCPACEAMAPLIDAWERKNGSRLPVTRVDLADTEWTARNWQPEVTPTLVILRADGARRFHEGAMTTAKELNGWIREALG